MLGKPGEAATEDEMVGWYHQLNGHESEQAPGDGERQGSLQCYSPWGHKASDMIEELNNNRPCHYMIHYVEDILFQRKKILTKCSIL